jgi:DNA-binding transcriptional LysR family regulator
MEVRQLELFLAVIESGSVTRASERVFLSPGAVSMQLHQLSTELRTELFIRSGRKFLPTPAALRLAEHARGVIRRIREIEQEFEADPTRDLRPLYFSTGATALIYCLSKPLRQVRAKYPEAEIRVTVAATEQTVAGLLERRYDLGLITLPYPEEGLKIVPLFEEELLVLQPSRSVVRTAAVGTIKPSELDGRPFLLYPHTSNMRSIIDGFFRGCGVTPRVVMEADDTEAIKGLVESGFGYAVVPKYAVRSGSRHFRTFRVAGHRVARTQALAMPRTEYPRVLAAAIAEILRVELAKL